MMGRFLLVAGLGINAFNWGAGASEVVPVWVKGVVACGCALFLVIGDFDA